MGESARVRARESVGERVCVGGRVHKLTSVRVGKRVSVCTHVYMCDTCEAGVGECV